MLKVIIFMLFMLIIKNSYWRVKENIVLLFFLMGVIYLPSFYSYISYFFLIDFLSYMLLILSVWITILMLLASEKILSLSNTPSKMTQSIFYLLLFLMFSFSVSDFLLFFIFYEASLIPTLFLILGWGYQPERIVAGFYFLFYTVSVSLPLLILLLTLLGNTANSSFLFLVPLNNFYIFHVCLILPFLVKMPMFLIHSWLPKAHVEAPIAGSMILAAILLKLGGYGLLRLTLLYLYLNTSFWFYLFSINMVGSILLSIKCLSQMDLKSLVAYSSIVHMSFILMCIFNFSNWSIVGGILMMVAHGFSSSGMFFLANVTYDRFSSRSMLMNKGLTSFMPTMSIWWFLLLTSNMAAPPSLNLLSEILLLSSILSWSFISLFTLIVTMFFTGCYCIYMYSYTQHGLSSSVFYSYSLNFPREHYILFLHWVPLNILFLKNDFCFLLL